LELFALFSFSSSKLRSRGVIAAKFCATASNSIHEQQASQGQPKRWDGRTDAHLRV
jgi:hypothetical protein